MEPLTISTFKTFWINGVHGGCWTKEVYSVVNFKLCINVAGRCTGEQRVLRVFKNDAAGMQRHSEENAINHLREVFCTENCLHSQTIQWYVNFSPCQNCSDLICQFIEEVRTVYNITVKINMKVSSLYKIRRLSCELRLPARCTHQWSITNGDHEENVAGLVQLQRNGITVATFEENDWQDLANWLGYVDFMATVFFYPCFTYQGTPRHFEDTLLKQDLQYVMWTSNCKGVMARVRPLRKA